MLGMKYRALCTLDWGSTNLSYSLRPEVAEALKVICPGVLHQSLEEFKPSERRGSRVFIQPQINGYRCSLNLINSPLSMNAKLIGPNQSPCQ